MKRNPDTVSRRHRHLSTAGRLLARKVQTVEDVALFGDAVREHLLANGVGDPRLSMWDALAARLSAVWSTDPTEAYRVAQLMLDEAGDSRGVGDRLIRAGSITVFVAVVHAARRRAREADRAERAKRDADPQAARADAANQPAGVQP